MSRHFGRNSRPYIIGIIPARMGSSRFPGKPLAKILGRAMIYHVYRRSKLAKILDDVYIAACDKEIEDYCLANGMKVVMTKATHERASDRAAEAMLKIEKDKKRKADIVVMIQGDEPMVFPEMINLAVKEMEKDKGILVVNLMSKVESREEEIDPNTVKVVTDRQNLALYFSREPIPSRKIANCDVVMHKQVPIIPFRRDFLIKFNRLPQGALEIIESVDMLRVIEHGYKVKMTLSPFCTYGVDTPQDLKRVINLMKDDALVSRY